MNEVEFAFRPDPNRNHPPIDETVKLPRQVRLAAERAEDLIAGKQPRPVEVNAASAKSGSASKFPTDHQMDAARAWLEAKVDPSNPDSTIALEIFREGKRIIEARRRGAQKPRKTSKRAVRRVEFLLQAFKEFTPKFQKHPTGQQTVERLRKAVMQKLGVRALSEETVRRDIREIRSLIRLVQTGNMPPPGQPRPEAAKRIRRQVEARQKGSCSDCGQP